MLITPAPRKFSPTIHYRKVEKSPLQTLMQLGISKALADKALAATGNVSAQKAANWLVCHVNDPRLDEVEFREYILCAVPIGTFGELLMKLWNDSRRLCKWNEAHNQFPHITLVSFFKAPPENEPSISTAVKQVLDNLNAYLEHRIDLKLKQSATFIGYFVEGLDKDLFKKIAEHFADAVKTLVIQSDIERTSSTSAFASCCPWLTTSHSTGRCTQKGSIDGMPDLNLLHLMLAYNYDRKDSSTIISSLIDKLHFVDTSSWELRLYSRDSRVGTNQVFRALQNYDANRHDELNIKLDDYIVASEAAVENGDEEGWIFGSSLNTGESGYFPANHSYRVPESDCWSLHARVHFIGSRSSLHYQEPQSDVSARPAEAEEPLDDCARANIDAAQKTSPWKSIIGKLLESENCSSNQKLLIMRHAERVDYVFPKWTEQCFGEEFGYERLDLNLPLAIPNRRNGVYRYPWKLDAPITNVGVHQALLTGQMLKQRGIKIGFVYSSPAFRCIQTAEAVLKGLQAPDSLQIRVEPALYERCGHNTKTPPFLTIQELKNAGYNIDVGYVPLLTYEGLVDKQKSYENLEAFYERNHRVSDHAVKLSSANILIVAHAANLETNSRLLLGGRPMSLQSMRDLVERVPYTSLLPLEKCASGEWEVGKPLVLPLSHSRNFQFDTRIFSGLHRNEDSQRH